MAADGLARRDGKADPAVVHALVGAGCDAVWVGWGFVSERASFARRCEDAGIVFVGPTSETIRMLGDKVTAKRLAEGADVPVVPWGGGPVDDPEQAAEQAAELGYPVVLKASAGGGGRGIRIVRSPEDLPGALASARGLANVVAGVNTAREEAYAALLGRGYRIDRLGVAMHRPNEPGYSEPGVYVIDDWR